MTQQQPTTTPDQPNDPRDERLKTYTVNVTHTIVCGDEIEVRARSEDEAIDLAKEEFQFDWERSELVDVSTEVIGVKDESEQVQDGGE